MLVENIVDWNAFNNTLWSVTCLHSWLCGCLRTATCCHCLVQKKNKIQNSKYGSYWMYIIIIKLKIVSLIIGNFLFEILYERFVSSPTFIYLFIQSLIYIIIDLWKFILFWVMSIKLYFVAQIVTILVIGSYFRWLLCPFDIPHQWELLFNFEHLLTFLHYKMIQACRIFSTPILESAIHPRIHWTFYWRMISEVRSEYQVCVLLLGCHCF